jgi:hypothetical protein
MNSSNKLYEAAFKDFQELLNSSDFFIYFQLGAGAIHEVAPPDVLFDDYYDEKGRKLWAAIKREIYHLLCDPESKEPKFWVNEAIGGDIRELATTLISLIAANFSVGLGIAIPAAALIVKKGVLSFCRDAAEGVGSETVQQFLEREKKEKWEAVEQVKKMVEEELSKRAKNKRKKKKKRGSS